jgi:hypothetical protein
MRPFTSVVNSDLMEHTEPICMYNLPANVGHFVSLRHVKIFFITMRGREDRKKEGSFRVNNFLAFSVASHS